MQATLSTRSENYSQSHRRDGWPLNRGFYVIDPATGRTIVDVRTYWPGKDGASPCYCAIWTRGHDESQSRCGTGKAGGYGYHKISAAVGQAIHNAGWDLSEDIEGVGETAVKRACLSLAEACGVSNGIFFEAHP